MIWGVFEEITQAACQRNCIIHLTLILQCIYALHSKMDQSGIIPEFLSQRAMPIPFLMKVFIKCEKASSPYLKVCGSKSNNLLKTIRNKGIGFFLFKQYDLY